MPAPQEVCAWTLSSYRRARSPYQYGLDRDTNNLFFHTKVQEEAFYGHMLNKVVFRHQTIDFNYMADYVVLYELVEKFENLGLKAFLEHRCDWNDTIIRQFYATVEVNMEEESLEWMTGKRKYEATFGEFATANELNYDFLTSASRFDISLEDPLSLNDIIHFYEPLRTGIP